MYIIILKKKVSELKKNDVKNIPEAWLLTLNKMLVYFFIFENIGESKKL